MICKQKVRPDFLCYNIIQAQKFLHCSLPSCFSINLLNQIHDSEPIPSQCVDVVKDWGISSI